MIHKKKEEFQLHAAIFWTINDFPAYVMLSGWSTKGYLACPVCGKDTDSRRLQKGNKNCYMGHRRFLPIKHRWRLDKKSFDGTIEKWKAPNALSGLESLWHVNQIPSITFGKDPNKRKTRKKDNQYQNWRKKSIFFELPYWHELLIRHNLDMMHVEKNAAESIIGILIDAEKSKDNLNARFDLQKIGVQKDLHPILVVDKKIGKKKYEYAVGTYTLSKEERRKFCKFLLDLKLPHGFSSNITRCVNLQDGKLQNMKSHDWHCLLQRHLPLAVGALLPKNISRTIIEFSALFRELC
jgi:Transposase family tnp2